MEEDLKKWNISATTDRIFLNFSKLSLGDHTKIKFGLKFEMKTTSDRPPIEDDLKILKVEYLSNH